MLQVVCVVAASGFVDANNIAPYDLVVIKLLIAVRALHDVVESILQLNMVLPTPKVSHGSPSFAH